MSNEVQFGGPGTGHTCYFTVHNQTSGQVWNTSGSVGAFENFVSGNWTLYAISAVEQGASNFYAGNIPAAVPPGVLSIDARQQVGGGAAQTDPRVAAGDIQWGGSAVIPLSDLPNSGILANNMPVRLTKGVAVSGFPLYLKSAADHVTPFTSGVGSGQISRNGAPFTSLQSGVFTEVGLGTYTVNLTSGDLNADTIMMIFTATGVSGGTSDPLPLAFIMQKTSGSF